MLPFWKDRIIVKLGHKKQRAKSALVNMGLGGNTHISELPDNVRSNWLSVARTMFHSYVVLAIYILRTQLSY